jgi:hypothetical protein
MNEQDEKAFEECKECDQSVGYTCVGCEIEKLFLKIKKLEEQNKKLRECVEFYASPDNYFLTTHQRPRVQSGQRVLTVNDMNQIETHIFPVGGKRARQCLKEIGVENE